MPQAEAETFQHYRVLRREDGSLWKLGAGAMGVTYKAVDTNLDAPVALKVISALYTGKDAARERFIREAKAAASLRHRNVASIHHLGRDEDSFFYAMEFIDGETVEHFVQREGPQSWRLALPIVLQVTRALMAAHEKHIVHRDIKPANIMLVREVGEDDLVVKVIDFGLAKSLVEEGGSVGKVSGSGFLGTPLYASPEQCEELAPDIRSDIYSLGVTLWFVLAGRPPFEGGLGKVFSQHLHAPPPWVQIHAAVPEPVRALLARMLSKDRADRPQTPASLRRDIETCLRACGQSVPAAAPPKVAEKIPDAPQNDWPSAETLSKTPAPVSTRPAPPGDRAADLPLAGSSLEDALRRNDGRLPATSVAELLGPLAQIIEAAGRAALDLTPGGIWVGVGNTGSTPVQSVPFKDLLLTGGMTGWLEVRAQDAARFQLPPANETIPPTRARFAEPVAALAALAYELLDGTAADPDFGYRPLSECDEESNVLLRRALEDGPSAFADAATFAAALAPSLRRRPAKAVDAAPPPLSQPVTALPKKRGSAVKIVVSAAAALLVLAAVGKLTFFSGSEPNVHPATAAPTPAPTETAAPALASSPVVNRMLPVAVPPKSTSAPSAASPPAENSTPAIDLTSTANAAPSPSSTAKTDYETGVNLWGRKGGTLIDYPRAMTYFQAAAAKGYAPAQAFLALAYRAGDVGIERDVDQSEKWAKASLESGLREQAQQGDAEAQLRLGLLHYSGIGVAKDEGKAVELFKKAVDQGNVPAEFYLANCYQKGFGVEKDLAKAIEFYKKAADQGNAAARNNLGMCYKSGTGVEKDMAKAFELFKKAADQGIAAAQDNLGECYENGVGVEKDMAKAVEMYKKAADQGVAVAQYHLGNCYEIGSGVERNLVKAVGLYESAADKGILDAQNNLGACYANGSGVKKDPAKAIDLFKRAADQGNANGKNSLGLCYLNGSGLEKDSAKAVELFKRAADQGNANAQTNLGACYFKGIGVAKDLAKAVELYKKAADQGNAIAQHNLGVCYEDGSGVEQDLTKAVALFKEAADQGNADAQSRLRSLRHDRAK